MGFSRQEYVERGGRLISTQSRMTLLDDEKRLTGAYPWEVSLEKGFGEGWKHFYLSQTDSGLCEKQESLGLCSSPLSS